MKSATARSIRTCIFVNFRLILRKVASGGALCSISLMRFRYPWRIVHGTPKTFIEAILDITVTLEFFFRNKTEQWMMSRRDVIYIQYFLYVLHERISFHCTTSSYVFLWHSREYLHVQDNCHRSQNKKRLATVKHQLRRNGLISPLTDIGFFPNFFPLG